MRFRLACCLLALAAIASSQVKTVPRTGPPPVTPATVGPPRKPGTMEGVVTDSITHAPIRKATVQVNSVNLGYSSVGISGEDGKFQIANLDPGPYWILNADAQGYRYQMPRSAASNQIVVAEDQHVTGVKVELQPLGVISGKVVDDGGEPMRDVQMEAMSYDYSRGVRTLRTSGSGTTNDRGEYRIFNLSPGRYFVQAWVSPEPFAQQGRVMAEPLLPNTIRTTPETGFAPTFFPNGSDPAQSTAAQVTPGNEVSAIDFRLRSVPVFHIRGKVNTGQGGPNRAIIAGPCEGPAGFGNAGQFYAPAQPDGQFDIPGVPAGSYCVTLQGNFRGDQEYARETVSVKDRNVDGVTLNPAAVNPLNGVIVIDGQTDRPPPPNISLQQLNGYGRNFNGPVKDGKFTITGVVPDKYQVMLRAVQQGLYLKSMQYGSQDVSEGLLDLRNDSAILTLVLGTDVGQLSGTVQTENGDPAINIQVTVAPVDRLANRRDLLKIVTTDTTGHFQINSLAPGDYKVYAWEDSDIPMLASPDFRKEFSSRAAPVTVRAGGQDTVQVKAISSAEIQKVKGSFQ